MPKFAHTWCSSCGQEFGPGDSGYSHCKDHKREMQAMTFVQIKEASVAELERRLAYLRIETTYAWHWHTAHEIQCIVNELERRGVDQTPGDYDEEVENYPARFM